MIQGLEEAKVTVRLNQEVTRQLVEKENPDVVVVATGAKPASLDVPGADGKNVVQAVDVFLGEERVGERVVVVGGRYRGMEAAIFLAKEGKKVSLVTRSRLGRDVARWMYLSLRDHLINNGVFLYLHAPVREIKENGVTIEFEKEIVFLETDTVVLSVGSRPKRKLIAELRGVVPEVYAIGDCVEPRYAMDAIREGAEVGRKI
jgi:2,4-dienoyl-CoA reductase (NADPH2)